MKTPTFLISLFLIASCQKQNITSKGKDVNAFVASSLTTKTNKPSHIVFVWFENKGTGSIIGSANAPYVNSLKAKGTYFSNTYATHHPSYPNYIALFSASNQGITNDNCISGKPFSKPNLYTSIAGAGNTFKWYSENLPSAGSEACTASGYYVEKHNPTTVFSNVPDSINQPLSKLNLTGNFSTWPQVVMISPTKVHDMHDGSTTAVAVKNGDAWLKTNLDKYVQWALSNNSILVVYFDEDDKSNSNKIPVVVVGQHVPANVSVNTRYDHYNWTKMLATMYGKDSTWNSSLTSRTSVSIPYK